MNYTRKLTLIASLKINREQEEEFMELAKLVFPPLASETKWQLTSLKSFPEENVQTINIQNLWRTNDETTEQVETGLHRAIETLTQNVADYQRQLEMLDALIVEETISYATGYTI
ncbi:MAG: hypothetical protein ACPG5L_03685 [Vibrio gallaecicus]